MMVISDNTKVFATAEGRHFHMFSDCRGLWQGRSISAKYDRDVWSEHDMSYIDAVYNGKYGCVFCHKRAGVEVPEYASLKVARAKARAEREAKRAAKAAAETTVETVVEAVPANDELPVVAEETVDALMAQVNALLAQINLLINA
jgi:hypothetical protein